MNRGALIDGLYRYTLTRNWCGNGALRTLGIVMLNPSTADGSQDDPTIRRCIGFAVRTGFNAIEVRNLFALRATNPEELTLRRDIDVRGPHNNAWLCDLFRFPVILCAWGTKHHDLHGQASWFRNEAKRASAKLVAVKITVGGHPSHPLYVPYGPFVDFV